MEVKSEKTVTTGEKKIFCLFHQFNCELSLYDDLFTWSAEDEHHQTNKIHFSRSLPEPLGNKRRHSSHHQVDEAHGAHYSGDLYFGELNFVQNKRHQYGEVYFRKGCYRQPEHQVDVNRVAQQTQVEHINDSTQYAGQTSTTSTDLRLSRLFTFWSEIIIFYLLFTLSHIIITIFIRLISLLCYEAEVLNIRK